MRMILFITLLLGLAKPNLNAADFNTTQSRQVLVVAEDVEKEAKPEPSPSRDHPVLVFSSLLAVYIVTSVKETMASE